MPDSSLHTMMRVRTTLYNQKQRAIKYREENPIPRGLILAKLTATDINTEKILEQDSYITPDSPLRRPPIISVAGQTIYTRDDTVFIYFNNIGGPVKLYKMITPLPTGITLDEQTGFITGTALVRQPNTRYLIKAENDFGENILDFSIRILYKPPVISYTGSPFNFIKNAAITPIYLSNTSDPIESVTGTLPPGLSLNSITGVITGTPTAVSAQDTYSITASNEGGSDTTEIQIQVWIEAPFFTYTYGPYAFTVSNAITPIVPSGILGDPIFYVAPLPAPQLPINLSINSNNGIISGIPIIVTSSNEYIIKGSNLGPSGVREYAAYFGMEIMQPPPNISYSPSTVTFTQNSVITNMIVTNTGGPATSFSVTPALPSGIILNTTTGTISGTPLVDSAATSYVVTATGNGSSLTTISITINPAAPVISYSSPQNYAIGSAITSLSPTNSGGTVASYALVGSLPPGLSLNTTTGIISGTPTTLAVTATFIVQASNITGTSTAYIDIAIVRPTPLGIGSFLWAGALAVDKTGLSANNFVTGVATDSSSNAYVTGYYLAPTSVVLYSSNISGSNNSALPKSSTQRVGYYAKYDSNGAFQYASGLINTGTSNSLTNNGITVDTYNNVYICGRYSGGANIYNSNNSSTDTNMLPFTDAGGTTYGAYAVKYNSSGSNILRCGIVALTTISGLGIAEAADVKVDSTGAIYISGSYRATSSFYTLAYSNNTSNANNFLPATTGTSYNTFLVKFNSNGSLAWGAAIGNTVTGSNVSNFSMAIDSADNIYLVGSYYGATANINIYSSNVSLTTTNVLSTTTNSRSDSYLVKFGSNGMFAGAASINACNYDGAGSIAIDNSNNIYVSGFYAGLSNTAYIVNSNKSLSNNNVLPTISTGYAQYMIKFNNNLEFQMALAVDSRASNVSSNNCSVVLDTNNNIYLAGTCSNSYNIRAYNSNQNTSTTSLIKTGSGDASYIICYNSVGQVQYGASIANSFTYINKSIAGGVDYLYIAGMYSNTSNALVAYDSNYAYYSSNILPTPIQANVCNTYLVKYKI